MFQKTKLFLKKTLIKQTLHLHIVGVFLLQLHNFFNFKTVPIRSSGVTTCLASDYVGRAQQDTWTRER